jgi:signal transduction histidine kinase
MHKLYFSCLTAFLLAIFPSCLFCFNSKLDSLLYTLQTQFEGLNTAQKAALLHNTALEYLDQESYHEAEKYFRSSLDLSRQEGLKKLTVDNYYYLGISSFWQSAYQESIDQLNQSLQVFPDALTSEDSFYILDQLGASYFYMGELEQSFDARLRSNAIAKAIGDDRLLATSIYGLAEVEKGQREYGRALELLQEALQIAEKAGRKVLVNYCYDMLGDIYHEQGAYEKALEYKIKSCEIVDSTLIDYSVAYCNHNLALTYAKMGNYEQAISLFSEALELRQKTGQQEEAAQSLACLGELIAWQGDCQGGMNMLGQSLLSAQQLELKPLLRDVYEKLYLTAKHCGDFDKSIGFFEKYIHYRDTISGEKTKMKIANLNAKQELSSLQLDILKKDNHLGTLYILLLGVGIGFLALTSLFVFRLYKKQQSLNRLQAERASSAKAHNRELALTNSKLQAANKELEQFAYLISHDLKAPLRTMGSYASLLDRRYKNTLDDEGRTFLRFITEDAKHMSSLLEDILSYSKIGKTDEGKKAVNLNHLMEMALRLLHGTVQQKGAIVEVATLPTVNGYETQLHQLFQNLIDNALKFVPDGRRPHVRVAVKEEGEFFSFSVSDNGIGIDPSLQAQIFMPFKRLHNRSEYEGTGIGLSICKKIVEQHGGSIWVESDGESGTAFCFTIQK